MADSEFAAGSAGEWLLDALGDGVILIDPDWSVRFLNRSAERLLRVSRQEALGKVIGRDFPEPAEERMHVYREVMEKGGVRVLQDVVLNNPELVGRAFEGEVHGSPSGGIALVFRDVTERRAQEEAATRFGRLLEASGYEVYIFDAQSLRFRQVSRGARENLGYTLEELHHLTPLAIHPEFDEARFSELLHPLRSGQRAQIGYETVHRRRDGSEYPVEVRLQLNTAEPSPVFLAVVLDITERRLAQEQMEAQAVEMESLNEELRQQAAELEAALATRNRFYAQMSHELRTPINAVVGYNDLILAGIYGEVPDTVKDRLRRSQRAAHHLMEIVNDVLDLSRLEAGKIGISPEEVDLRQLLQDLLATAHPLAEQHGSELQLGAEGCAQRIRTDPRRVRQILLNLISNAARFGRGRPIELRCSRTPDGQGVAVEVEDHGIGIPPEAQQRIFEEFVQLETADTGNGTGLGLPISRRLAQLLGGTLTVRSKPDQGSVFRLTLQNLER